MARISGGIRFVLVFFLAWACCANEPQAQALPLDVAASARTVSGYDLAPDGGVISYEYVSADEVAGLRRQTDIVDLRNGAKVTLGGGTSEARNGVWSPDSASFAYVLQTDDGDASLWIWSRSSGTSRRIGGLQLRRTYDPRRPVWFADSTRLLVTALPSQMERVARVETLAPEPQQVAAPRILQTRGGHRLQSMSPPAPVDRGDACSDSREARCDLVIVNVRDGSLDRIAVNVRIWWYAPSPDQQNVAFTTNIGRTPHTEQLRHDLQLFNVATHALRTLAPDLEMNGSALTWAPDSGRIAYILDGQTASGALQVLSLDSAVQSLDTEGLNRYPEATPAPLWDRTGHRVFASSKDEGALVWLDIPTGNRRTFSSTRISVETIVTERSTGSAWSTRGRNRLLVAGRDRRGTAQGIYEIDLETDDIHPITVGSQSIAFDRGVSVGSAQPVAAFLAGDQQHLREVWEVALESGAPRRITHLNDEIYAFPLGRGRLVSWTTPTGRRLQGTLLLPPDYDPGSRLPLVVWVYGSSYGSHYVDEFGLWGAAPAFNFHVLATRGYAIFYPDVPLRVGFPAQDHEDAVLSGVDALIRAGYIDPQRMAIMGQSYGSFGVLALITRTTRFRAAIITAVADPNLVRDYLTSRPGVGNAPTSYYERGQGQMGGTPWRYPERYRTNSPILRFDRIRTPVLIMEGELNHGYTNGAADSVFVALERLGQAVDYVIYPGEGHAITRHSNVIDSWQRRIAFLDEHLRAQVID